MAAAVTPVLLLAAALVVCCGAADPTLDDAWAGRAVLVPDVWYTGGSFSGRQWLMEVGSELWDYTTVDNYSPNVNCLALYRSSDGGVTFQGPVVQDGTPCLAPDTDTQQQQYPSVVPTPGGYTVVYEEGAVTWWRTTTDGLKWTKPTNVHDTGACQTGGQPYEEKHCGGCSTPPNNVLRGAPPGLWKNSSSGELFLFVDGGGCPACVLCFRGPSPDKFRLCDNNPLVSSGAKPSFDWHFLSGVQVIHVGDYMYLSYQGEVDLPHLAWAIGLARAPAADGPDSAHWEKMGGTGLWYNQPPDADGSHSHTLLRDGKTYVYLRRSRQSGSGRNRLVWKDLPTGPCGPMIRTDVPIGIGAYGGLATNFPREYFFEALRLFESPFVTLALDFGRLYQITEYNKVDVQMYSPGEMGHRDPNPNHLAALRSFLADYITHTPDAAARHFQFFLIDGPGYRGGEWQAFPVAYNISIAELNERLVSDTLIRDEITRYLKEVVKIVEEVADGEQIGTFRFTGGLEDNMPNATAQSLAALIKDAGWRWQQGRNPCPKCAPQADNVRLGQGYYHELHVNFESQIDSIAEELQYGDSYTNDGWFGNISVPNIGKLTTAAAKHGLLHHYWYDPIQGYENFTKEVPKIWHDRPACVLAQQIAAGLPSVP